MLRLNIVCGLTITVLFTGMMGCSKNQEDSPATSEASQATDADTAESADAGVTPKATPVEEAAPVPPSPLEARRATLRSSFLELNCLRKSSGTELSLAVYKKAGFEDAASWSKAWHEEAEKNVEWASKIIEEASEKGCKVKLEAPLE